MIQKLRWCLGTSLVALLVACGGDDSSIPGPTPPVSSELFNLDTSVSACVDLNAHVNNHWMSANPLRPEHTDIVVTWELDQLAREQLREWLEAAPASAALPMWQRQLREFYHDGMNEVELDRLGFAPARFEWDRIAGLQSKAELRQYVQDRLVEAKPILLKVEVWPDLNDSSRNILHFKETTLGMPTRDYFLDPEFASYALAYERFLGDLLVPGGEPEAAAREKASWALEVEQQIARHTLSPVEAGDPNRGYQLVTLADAEQLAPGWDWEAYLRRLQVDVNLEFSIMPGGYFTAISELIEALPIPHWQAYLQAQWARESAPYLDRKMRHLYFEFNDRLLRGREAPVEHWVSVIRTMNRQMGELLGRIYVEHYFEPERRELALDIQRRVLEAARYRLTQLEWLSEDTRLEALAKIDAMTFDMAYPDSWTDWSDLELTPGDYFGNVFRLQHYRLHQRGIPSLGPVGPSPAWPDWPHEANALYGAAENHMFFLAALLNPPLLDLEADMAVNLGAFGGFVGHEIHHAFDSIGSQFDASGNLRNWWSEESRAAFEASIEALRWQAEDVLPWPHRPDLKVDGLLTLDENIADLGGVSAAYDALQKYLAEFPQANQPIDGLTPEQRFFLSWAQIWRSQLREESLRKLLEEDPHAPEPVRVVLPLMNHPAFADTFGCTNSQPMALPPDQQISIW